MLIKGRVLDAPLVVAAAGMAAASGSAALAHDYDRAFGLLVAASGLFWKAVRS